MTHSIIEEFRWRNLIFDMTEGTDERLIKEKIAFYIGFDPTADSLHIGNLVPMMSMARLQRTGHTPIALAGGGTGMIGDPSGRSSERNLLTLDTIEENLVGIKAQLASVLDFEVKGNPAKLVNNADWLKELNLLAFLRDIGKHFTVNYMLSKDSVQNRLERDDVGISFTEFTYMLLQAYDFFHLFQTENCVMQAGGSDQYGNITAGVELIRRKLGQKAHGLVYPLLTKADGSKFGKTAEGTIWLSPERTSPFQFYQYWLNADDRDVAGFLKVFTWLNRAEIEELEEAVVSRPHERLAQRTLAQHVTRMIHGDTALAKAEQASAVLFGGDMAGLDARDIQDIFAEVPSSELPKSHLENGGVPVVDLLVQGQLATSKGDARRKIQGGGIYLNNVRVNAEDQTATVADALQGQFFVLRQGKRNYHLIKLLS